MNVMLVKIDGCHVRKLLLFLIILLFASGVSFAQNQIPRKPKERIRIEQPKPKPNPGGKKPKPESNPEPKLKPKATNGYINEHEWIDLGLPSGLKWATCNVGALSPEGYGDYFAWGETTTKSKYTESNSRTYERSVSDLQSAGIISSAENLTPAYDAARVNWGGSWRMPTKAEMEELKEKCRWTWTSQGGHNGYRVTGPNGNSIFLPTAGFCGTTSLVDAGEEGDYWSSSCPDGSTPSYYLEFKSDNQYAVTVVGRYFGFSVRAVSE